MNKDTISFEDLELRMLNHIGQAKALTGAEIEFTYQVSKAMTFSSLVGINIFRIMQEAINNAIKHADAKKINIQFSDVIDEYVLLINDNGKGFDYSAVQEKSGIENMELRAEEIHGKLSVISGLGHGTTINLTIDKEVTNTI